MRRLSPKSSNLCRQISWSCYRCFLSPNVARKQCYLPYRGRTPIRSNACFTSSLKAGRVTSEAWKEIELAANPRPKTQSRQEMVSASRNAKEVRAAIGRTHIKVNSLHRQMSARRAVWGGIIRSQQPPCPPYCISAVTAIYPSAQDRARIIETRNFS